MLLVYILSEFSVTRNMGLLKITTPCLHPKWYKLSHALMYFAVLSPLAAASDVEHREEMRKYYDNGTRASCTRRAGEKKCHGAGLGHCLKFFQFQIQGWGVNCWCPFPILRVEQI
ncbi:Hypothetical predicted protein [Podarcis lilfordi]|uniref:Uncharacterized protein n=1 Tax=Podarcis lilfordi TaxID=74358 RepID=A0AA35JS27_9SAUR|nr:Hypothetical predicted protein [Podarcis lilfordi]